MDVTNLVYHSTHELVEVKKRVGEEGRRKEGSSVWLAQGFFKNNF